MNLIKEVTKGVSPPSFYLKQPLSKTPSKVYPNGFSLLPTPGVRKERLQFPEFEVPVSKGKSLLAPVKLAFLSDIHMDEINTNWLFNALPHIQKLIKDKKIDGLLFGGDYICQGKGFIRDLGKWVKSLDVGIPMIGILGNHDHLTPENGTEVFHTMQESGVTMLEDASHVQNFDEKGKIVFHGWADYLGGKPNSKTLLKNITTMPDMTHVGLIHNPKQVEVEPDLLKYLPLILAGHTHGGQIAINHCIAQYLTQQRYVGGLYKHGEDQGDILVGKGMGTGTILLKHHPRIYAFLNWLGIKKDEGLSFALPRWWEGFSEVPIITLAPEGNR
jgi:predicted MPP superfamily phosphohydrolase